MDRGIRRPSPHRHRGTGLDSLKSRRTGAPGRLRTPPQGRNRAHPGLRPPRSGHPAPSGASFVSNLRTCMYTQVRWTRSEPSRWTIPEGFCQILRKHDEILTNWPKIPPHFSLVSADFLGRSPGGQASGAHGPGAQWRKSRGKTLIATHSRNGVVTHTHSGLIIHGELIRCS